MNCLRLQTEVADNNKEGFSRKKKDANSAALQLKLFGSKPLFYISAQAFNSKADLRLKPEAIHKTFTSVGGNS